VDGVLTGRSSVLWGGWWWLLSWLDLAFVLDVGFAVFEKIGVVPFLSSGGGVVVAGNIGRLSVHIFFHCQAPVSRSDQRVVVDPCGRAERCSLVAGLLLSFFLGGKRVVCDRWWPILRHVFVFRGVHGRVWAS